MITKAMKVICFFSLFGAIFLCLAVNNSEANGIDWTHEWVMLSAYYGDQDSPGWEEEITDVVETSGHVEAYKVDPLSCDLAADTCFEINSFEFTIIDTLGDEYSWSVYNESRFVYHSWGEFGVGLVMDFHLEDNNYISFGYPETAPHDGFTCVGYYGFFQTGCSVEIQTGLILGGFWTEIQSVPEPTTMLLLGSGLFGLGAYGRKLKK